MHEPHTDEATGTNRLDPDPTTHRRAMLAGIGGLAAGALLAGKANAGPLNPPPGRIEPTPGPEPRTPINSTNTPGNADALFRITQPGSYYLTGNITGVAGKHGIEIAASGVTLDLMGFDLLGVVGSIDGVRTSESGLTNVAIRNGSVRNWGGTGVSLFIEDRNCSVVDVRASGNGGNGIQACPGSIISGCTTHQNAENGILMAFGCTVSGCTATFNAKAGIQGSISSTISGCTAHRNSESGIVVFGGCTITECSVSSNLLNGILATGECTISGCTAVQNTSDGIRVDRGNLVTGNTCSSNGLGLFGDGAGIHATGSNNRVEANICRNADRGIDVDGTGNIIIRNTCSGNTVNWDIAAGNAYGPIVSTPSGAAVNGNTAPAALGSTDPNANFTY